MSQLIQTDHRRMVLATVSGVASFTALAGLFIATMLTHYRTLDFDYLLFALVRISAISVLVAGAAVLVARWLRSLVRAGLFGATLGLMGGLAYVVAAA